MANARHYDPRILGVIADGSSSKPGYAMKATEPGATVGIALEAFDGSKGEGKVLCFVDIGERNTGERIRKAEDRIQNLEDENRNLQKKLDSLEGLVLSRLVVSR